MSKCQVLLNEHWHQRRGYTPFSLQIQGHSCKLLFQKVGLCLVTSRRMWFWKQLRTKMRKKRPKTDLQYAHLLHDNAVTHKFWSLKRSTFCRILPSAQIWSRLIFSYLRNWTNICLVDFGSAVPQFLMGVPKDEYKIVSKIGLKDLNDIFWLKGNISKVTRQKHHYLWINTSEKRVICKRLRKSLVY